MKGGLQGYLTGATGNPDFSGEIRWNFDKFLFNRKGEPVGRFHPKAGPDDAAVVKAVEAALAQ